MVSKSAVAAQAEVQVHVGKVVDAFATCSGHEKQSRGAGRGTCACVHSCGPASATDSGLEKRIGSAGRGAGVGIVVDDFATCSRHEKRSRGAGRGAGVGIFLDAFTTDSRYEKRFGSAGRGTQVHCAQLWVGRLQIVGTTSEAGAQIEAQIHVCIGVGGRATDRRDEKRSGSAGRGTSACVHRCGWAGYGI